MSRDLNHHFFCLKDSTWAPYEQGKTVSRTFWFCKDIRSQISKIACPRRCLPVRGHVVSVVTTTRAHVFREYLRENEKIRETVFAF